MEENNLVTSCEPIDTIEALVKKSEVKSLEKQIKDLKNQIKKLKNPDPKFKIGDVVMCKENKLLMRILSVSKKRPYVYTVAYAHLNDSYGFPIDETKLEEKPYHYDEIIFNAYLDCLDKLNNLTKDLYYGRVRDKK